jgi:hypothetical protein
LSQFGARTLAWAALAHHLPMKNEREYPRYDIKTVTRGDAGFAAFLIDHDTGDSWVFDVDLSWKKIRRSNKIAKPRRASRKR